MSVSNADAIALALAQTPDAPLCVAYSGGLDSTVLLHALAARARSRGQRVRAWHVHHGLHPNAEGYKIMAPLAESAIRQALSKR